MKTQNTLPKIMAILFFIISIVSCQEDFNTIGGDIVANDSLLSQLDNSQTVVAYSRKLAPVQTNIIPVSQLGIYNDVCSSTTMMMIMIMMAILRRAHNIFNAVVTTRNGR